MEGCGKSVRAGAAIAVMATALVASGSHGAGAEPDISGVWWAKTYSPRILLLGGGNPPLSMAGKAQYEKNKAGLKDGTLVDKARKVCVPDGVPRVLENPYPFEIFQVPAGQVTMIYELNHQLRVIALNKPMRKYEELALAENYNGYSVGHYEGDNLVVQSNGFNNDTFLDSTGLPHSDEMITTERIRKIGNKQLEDVVTIHDPKMYTKDWRARFAFGQRNDIHINDYSCNDVTHRDISAVKGVNEARAARAEGRLFQ